MQYIQNMSDTILILKIMEKTENMDTEATKAE